MRITLFFAFFILLSGSIIAQNTLRYRLDEGDSFTIHQTALQYIDQDLGTGTQRITNDIRSQMEFTITSATDSVYEIDIEFKDLKMIMASDVHGELMNIDASVLDETDVQSKIFHSLIGVKVRMKMTPTGKVLEVNGGEQLINTMVKAAGFEDEFTREMLATSLQKEFGSEALSKSYEQMTFFYTPEQIAVGDTWNTEFNGKLSALNQWTLDNWSRDKSEISGTADAVLDVADDQTTMKLEGTQTSKLTVDSGNGLLRTLVVDGKYQGYSIVKQLGDEQIPTSIEMKLTYELIQ